MKTIHFWKAYNISNQKNNVYICSDSDMAAILHFVQNGRHDTGFCKYLSKIFLESMKTIHIWKAYDIRNQKKPTFPFAPTPIWPPSCILFKMATMKQVFVNISARYFLESMKTIHIWKAYNIRNQKKTMFTLAPSPIRPPSCICLQMATMKQVFVNISACK